MTDKRDEFFALIETSDKAHDQYIAKGRALEKAVLEALEKNDPQPGEAWLVLLPWSRSLKGVIPAIKTVTAWITDPGYLGEADPEDGYRPESAVIPLERVVEAPKGTEGAE